MRMPGVEPGSQAWEACMMPLHYMRHSMGLSTFQPLPDPNTDDIDDFIFAATMHATSEAANENSPAKLASWMPVDLQSKGRQATGQMESRDTTTLQLAQATALGSWRPMSFDPAYATHRSTRLYNSPGYFQCPRCTQNHANIPNCSLLRRLW